ncbi:MAG: protoporphyrinogen oxidase HemJ [Alphaproteobacteria bacterium]|nr:protoporphyrinogen oxidase HemJ [Alphaproteobacteria bacterium]
MEPHYLWIKALHIIAVIAWMAGMLYLPRLFVYHVGAAKGSELSERLKVMERRLMRAIINPAMIVAVALGVVLLFVSPFIDWSDGWIYAKLVFIAILTAIHGLLSRHRRDFEHDRNTKSERYFRVLNEAPAVLMVGIVIFVVVKPF